MRFSNYKIRECLCVIFILATQFVVGDNFHSITPGNIYCNGELLKVKCTESRWKISYLGADENICILEIENEIHINGVNKTKRKEYKKGDTIFFPGQYEIAVTSDKVYRIAGGTPKRVVHALCAILLSFIPSYIIYVIGRKTYT